MNSSPFFTEEEFRQTSIDYDVCDEITVQLFGRDILSAQKSVRSDLYNKAFQYWRTRGFPYPSLGTNDIEREFEIVQNVKVNSLIQNYEIRTSTVGLRLANSFHPQMWRLTAHSHKKSPVEHFNDDERLKTLLRKAPKFWPNRRCWNAQCVRSLFRIYSGGRVANFRPAAAKAIIEQFSKKGDTILDFCSGFSGRLLGSLALERHYIGIDPSYNQVIGSLKMLSELKPLASGTADICCSCAEDFMPKLAPNYVDLIFSSPPYFNVEQYCSDENQSCIRYSSYTDWIDGFLVVVMEESHRILKKGGYLILNIANARDYPLINDAINIAKPYFIRKKPYRLLMNTMPAHRSNGNSLYRYEPILIFRKRS